MLTVFSFANGPGRSNRCLPTTKPTPAATVIRNTIVSNALPAITNGLRTRLERRDGNGTCSGSSAARGLRGVIRLESIDAPSDEPDCTGGRGSLAAGTARGAGGGGGADGCR